MKSCWCKDRSFWSSKLWFIKKYYKCKCNFLAFSENNSSAKRRIRYCSLKSHRIWNCIFIFIFFLRPFMNKKGITHSWKANNRKQFFGGILFSSLKLCFVLQCLEIPLIWLISVEELFPLKISTSFKSKKT